MIPAIFLALVAGILIDKFGAKQVVGIGMAVTTLGCAIRIMAGSFEVLLVGTALTGFAACFINSGAAKILAGYYGPEGVGSKMGIFMAASTLAMTVALATSAAFGDIAPAFTVSAIISLVGTVLWFVVLKNPDGESSSQAEHGPSIGDCLKVVLASRNTWMIALALAFILGGNVVMGSFDHLALHARQPGRMLHRPRPRGRDGRTAEARPAGLRRACSDRRGVCVDAWERGRRSHLHVPCR